jgi:predicted unusual protein kinase regulating ubiquinone biosynthesis (AarF/ABC1/UbiB family)
MRRMTSAHNPRPGRAIRAGRVTRSARPAGLAAGAAARWAATYLAFGERRRNKRQQFVLRTAEDVTRTLGDMKGAAMKLGQVLSLMTGMVPDEMAVQLATLQSNAPPMASNLVDEVFQRDFGTEPRRVFRKFEAEPFAAASIGQVHRATLDDGTKVAVKVQYPGVREAIENDLANVGLLLSMAGMFSKGLDAGPMVRDLKSGIIAELDYLREAANQQRFHDIYDGHAFVRVPRVFHELTTPHVIVQEYIEGKPFKSAVDLSQAERNRVGEIVYRFSFGNIYRHGLFNGDPHPGNFLLTADGRVAFVDYGCVAEFSRATVGGFCVILDALIRQDLEAWRRGCEAVGILRQEAPWSTADLYEHMHWFWAPVLAPEVEFTPELAAEMVRRNTMTTGDGGRINRWLNIPEGMIFLTRINFGLAGLLASIGATGPWQGIIREYVYDEAPCTELGRRSAETSIPGRAI